MRAARRPRSTPSRARIPGAAARPRADRHRPVPRHSQRRRRRSARCASADAPGRAAGARPAGAAAALRGKARVVFQSAPRAARRRTRRRAACVAVMVGHLRDEKDPLTFMRAARACARAPSCASTHIGAALDPALGDAARAHRTRHAALPLARRPRRTRRRASASGAPTCWCIASRMEGGANVVIEAVQQRRAGAGHPHRRQRRPARRRLRRLLRARRRRRRWRALRRALRTTSRAFCTTLLRTVRGARAAVRPGAERASAARHLLRRRRCAEARPCSLAKDRR